MIEVKRNGSVFYTIEDLCEGSKMSRQLQDHHYVILKFTTPEPVYFEIGDSVEIPDFGYFEMVSAYFPKYNDTTGGYDYEMQMDADYMAWQNKICKYRPQYGANETSFKLTSTVSVHLGVILSNIKALGFKHNGEDYSVDYTTYNNGAFDVTKRFYVEYSSTSILDALNTICSEDNLDCEWWVDGSIIYLGYCEIGGQTTFEKDVNMASMSQSESKSSYITRLYAFGSDRNIPDGYFTGSNADVTTDGIATDYLMLPSQTEDKDGFVATNGYLENVNVVKNMKQAIEGVVMFEDEYPKVECKISNIRTYDSTVKNDDDTTTTQTFWQVTSNDSFATEFKQSWIKSNLNLSIKFTSGAMNGMEFELEYKIINHINYFEIVANDTYGRTLPDAALCPKVGDEFFLFNWDASVITDTSLIKNAQQALLERAKTYYKKSMIDNSNFTCVMDGEKFFNNGTYDYHPLGEQVKLIDPMFSQVDSSGKHYRDSRIIGMEINLDVPYDQPTYTVGEKAAASRLSSLESKVDSITVNGIQIGGTGNGSGIYIIKTNDSTPATDANVLSARLSRLSFLSKLYDDVANGFIWLKQGFAVGTEKLYGIAKDGVATLKDLFVKGDAQVAGDATILGTVLVDRIHDRNSTEADRTIVGAQGYDLYMGSDGKSHLYVDYLTARTKFFASQAEIRKVSYSGGTTLFSNAGSRIAKVAYVYGEDGKEVVAYKCYAAADDGTTQTANWWHVGMMALCQTFNVKAGQRSTDLQNRYYWRLVVGKGQEVLDDGKLYDYIILSNVKTFQGSAANVPVYTDGVFATEKSQLIEWGNVLLAITTDGGSDSLANIAKADEGITTDDSGTSIASRLFYGYEPTESGGEPDAPQPDDVIVQAGDQIRWKSYGNLIKQSTSTEDNASDTAPSTIYYHEMGAPYETGSVDTEGNPVVNPYQWKTVTAIISPAEVRFNADRYKLFQGDESNTIDPIVVMYDIVPSTQFMVRDQEKKTCTPTNITFTLQKRTGNKVETVTDSVEWYATVNGGSETLKATAASITLQKIGTPYSITSLRLRAVQDGTQLATFDLPIVTNGQNGTDGTSVSIKGKCAKHYANYAAIGTYGDIGTYVIVDSSADFPADKCSSDSTFAASPSVAEFFSAPDWDWRVRQAEAGDGYLDNNGDLWVAGETAWTNVGNIKGEQGEQGDDGTDAVEFVLSGSPMVFDTNEIGVVASTTSKTATIQAWQGGKNITSSVVFVNDTQENLSTAPAIGKSTDSVSVTVSGSSITRQTIDSADVSMTSGFAQVKAVYNGVIHYVQIPFSVNVAKFNHTVYSTAKESVDKYTEVSAEVKTAQQTATNAYNKAQGAQDSADNAQDAADKAQDAADKANDAIAEIPLNTEAKLTQYTSEIKQSAREISLEVQSETVGRRNMLIGSACMKQDGWIYMSGGAVCSSRPAERIEITSGMDGTPALRCRTVQTGENAYTLAGFHWIGNSPQGNIKVEKGKTYVLSFWAKAVDKSAVAFAAEVLWQGSLTDTTRPKGYAGPSKGYATSFTASENGKWERHEVVVVVEESAPCEYVEVCLFARAKGYTVTEAYLCRPMLEEASEYNGWTLSEHDYDYVGGNMLDNTASLTVGDNLTLVNGTVVSGGYDGDTAYTFASIDSTATDDHTEVLEWKTDGMDITALADYALSFMAKGSGRLTAYLYPSEQYTLSENSQGARQDVTDGRSEFTLTPQWRRYWVHWKPQATDQTNVFLRLVRPSEGTSSVYIAQPKLERGAVRTAYTERKTDLIDRQTLKRAGISIGSTSVELYGDQIKVSETKGGTPTAMFTDGKLSADLIDAKTIVVDGLQGNTIDAKDATIGNLNVTTGCKVGSFYIKEWTDATSIPFYYLWGHTDGTKIIPNQTTRIDNYGIFVNSNDGVDGNNNGGSVMIGSCNSDKRWDSGVLHVGCNYTDTTLTTMQSGIYCEVEGSDTKEICAIRASASMAKSNHAIYAEHGDFAGFRPAFRLLTSDYTLTSMDVFVEISAGITLILPSEPEVGQMYWVLNSSAEGTVSYIKSSYGKQIHCPDGIMSQVGFSKADELLWVIWNGTYWRLMWRMGIG